MTSPKSIAHSFLKTYKDTAYAKDLEGHVALFSKDVLLFDMWDAWSIQGIDALRKMTQEWFSSLGNERVGISYEDVHVTETSEMILATAIVKYSGLSAEGAELRYLQNRLTWVLKPSGADWKVIHQHTSAPVTGELKAILKR